MPYTLGPTGECRLSEAKQSDPRSDQQTDLEMLRSLISSAEGAVKASMLANGGAAVALLAFMGHVATEPTSRGLVRQFACPLAALATGLLSAACSAAVVYITQWHYYQGETRTGDVWRRVGLIAWLVSLLSLALGFWFGAIAFLEF